MKKSSAMVYYSLTMPNKIRKFWKHENESRKYSALIFLSIIFHFFRTFLHTCRCSLCVVGMRKSSYTIRIISVGNPTAGCTAAIRYNREFTVLCRWYTRFVIFSWQWSAKMWDRYPLMARESGCWQNSSL